MNARELGVKLVRAATKRVRIAAWRLSARVRTRSLLGDTPVAVSLTSYGHRLSSVFATIESIGAGEARPQRLILWLTPDEIAAGLPRTLRELERRGLEIIACEDYRSHKKYYPYATENEEIALPLVTADDDVLYPRTWLSALYAEHLAHPLHTIGYRGEVIAFDDEGHVLPYQKWRAASSTTPTYRLVLNGIGGIIYPVPVLLEARRHGTAFMEECPRGDDLWLHRSALRAGFAPRQLFDAPVHHPAIPGSQKTSLMSSNIPGGNDEQFARTYRPEDVDAIREDRRSTV